MKKMKKETWTNTKQVNRKRMTKGKHRQTRKNAENKN